MAHALFEAELQRTGEWIGELVHMTRDGRHLVVESRHQLLVESDGRQFVLETCRDITERLELEAEVRMSEMRLRLALDAAAMGTFIWHVAEDRTEADAQMLALFGLAPDGAITLAQALATMIHPEDTNRYAEAVARAIDPEGGGELREDIRVLLPDGSQRWLAVVGQVFFEREPRRPTYMAGAVTNITDRKDAEEALQRARSELEQRVRERTRELASANHSLRRLSRQVLEVQETERRRIARELHDEIGQALTGVKMMLETASLRNDARGPKEAAGIPPLFEERALIEDTLNRVRDLSLDLRPAMLDSLGLLPTLLWRFETYTRQTSIQVEFHHTRLDQRFAADIETGAYRIVQEALTNVARHAEVDVVRVQAKATKDKLRIFVIDEGRGFEANEAIAAGLSTGLASMRERATLLGGAFLVSSTPDAGTTIEVELPLSVGE
jgi:PAS domain S-box-containing protein